MNTIFGQINVPTWFPRRKQTPQGAKNLQGYYAPVALDRVKIDVASWRNSLKEAEQPFNPFRVKMQQIYQDTVINGHVMACMDRRRDLSLKKGFALYNPDGTENEAGTKLINEKLMKKQIMKILKYYHDAIFYGYSLINITGVVNGNIEDVEIQRRAFISPDREMLCQFLYQLSGIRFNDPSSVDTDGNSFYDWSIYATTDSENGVSICGNGLLYTVAYYEIFLRMITGFNANFIQIYGQPFRVGKTTKLEGAEYEALYAGLQDIGTNNFALIDAQDTIEFLETGQCGTGWKGYENLEQRMEDKITNVILGHKDAMKSTPGKLGATQGEDSPVTKALEDKASSDCDYLEMGMNFQVIPKLIKLGIKIPIGLTFGFKNDAEKRETRKKEDANNKVTADIAYTMKQAGMKMDAKYFSDRTGIPCTDVVETDPVLPNAIPKGLSKGVKNKLSKFYGKAKV